MAILGWFAPKKHDRYYIEPFPLDHPSVDQRDRAALERALRVMKDKVYDWKTPKAFVKACTPGDVMTFSFQVKNNYLVIERGQIENSTSIK